MTRVLLLVAAIGFTVSGAGACEYLKSAQAKIDNTTVASVATDKMSSAQDAQTPVVIEEKAE